MRKIFYWLALLPLWVKAQETTGLLHLTGELKPGNTVEVSYSPLNGPLKDEAKVFINVSFIDGTSSNGKTLPLKHQGTNWVTSIALPSGISFLGVQFHNNNGTADNKTYLFKIAGSSFSENLRTEKELDFYIRLYRQFDHQKQVDSLTLIRNTKYPNGEWVKEEYFSRFASSKDIKAKQAALNDMLKRFPGLFNDVSYPKDKFYEPMAQYAADRKDWKTFKFYGRHISPVKYAYLKGQAAYDLMRENKEPMRAEQLALETIEELSKPTYRQKFEKAGTSFDIISEKNDLEYHYLINALTYGTLAYQNGHFKEALPVLEDVAVNLLHKTDQRTYELYLKVLAKAASPKVALTAYENYYAAGNVSSDDLTLLFKQLYKSVYKKTDGFNQYFKKYEHALLITTRQNLLKELLDEPAPDFTLRDQFGNRVNLASLKGKTVILDYWATWCFFCKKAFPAMQGMVNKYKADSTVVFLFIDTQEPNANYTVRKQQILPYLASNKFNFRVLFDDKTGAEYTTYRDYKISGLPTKFIINPEGKIIFREVGFNGSDDELNRRLSLMIEISKNNALTGNKTN